MRRFIFLTTLLAVFGVPGGASAQLDYPVPVDDATVRLELAKPFLEGSFGDVGFATSILRARLLLPVGDNASLILGTGLTIATLEGAPSSQTLASPMVGFVVGSPEATYGHLTVELPLAQEFGDDDYATGVAILSQYEQLHAFVPDLLTISGGVTPQWDLDQGGRVGLRGGASVLIPTDDSSADTEVLVRYGVFGQFPVQAIELGVEVSGLALISESDLSLGERTLIGATLTVGLPGAAAPEIFVHVPLDDDSRRGLNAVLGFRVAL